MPVLDFREIPEAHISSGDQDRFELFARDFLEYTGYQIVEAPSRGPDGGKDLIVQDARAGVSGISLVRWLVSCKHMAHSGKAVSVGEEKDILDRVTSKECKGFLGFYSTLPSSPLAKRLGELMGNIETSWFDHEKIETELLRSPQGLELASRYFPESVSRLARENPRPPSFFEDLEPLRCDHCQKVLLEPRDGRLPEEQAAIILFWRRMAPGTASNEPEYVDINWCCKGPCDLALSSERQKDGLVSSWRDISDVCIPVVYLRWVMTSINLAQSGRLTPNALDKLRTFMLVAFHFVSRPTTSSEEARFESLKRIPSVFGGLG